MIIFDEGVVIGYGEIWLVMIFDEVGVFWLYLWVINLSYVSVAELNWFCWFGWLIWLGLLGCVNGGVDFCVGLGFVLVDLF